MQGIISLSALVGIKFSQERCIWFILHGIKRKQQLKIALLKSFSESTNIETIKLSEQFLELNTVTGLGASQQCPKPQNSSHRFWIKQRSSLFKSGELILVEANHATAPLASVT